MKHHTRQHLPLLLIVLLLNGCAGTPTRSTLQHPQAEPQVNAIQMQTKPQQILQLLNTGETDKARQLAEELALENPKSATVHMLLGLCYHKTGDAASLELASSGYNASRQFSGQGMWPNYLAGVVEMQRQNSHQALEHFSSAALADPDNAFVFEGLAGSAYASGNVLLAEHAARRVLNLQPDSVIGWRMLALSLAAQGKQPQLQQTLKLKPAMASEAENIWLNQRTKNLIRTAHVDDVGLLALNEEGQPFPEVAQNSQAIELDPTLPKQLTVDVTVILSDKRDSSRNGVNLLDGLQGTFGYNRNVVSTANSSTGADETNTSTRTITRTISIPDVTYNLNIFNRGDRYYDAIARPSLTAFIGQQSRFFIGDQLNVNVAGIQSAQIEKIDVGVSLKILPAEIRKDGARFQLEVDRSFLSDTNAGTFTQAIGTFKQTLSATADVKFGETLILSGLNESVGDNAQSKTPLLGDVPVVKYLFSNKTTSKRARSAIILVTPSLPSSFAKTVDYAPATKKLIALWDTVIEPNIGNENLMKRIARMPQFTRAAYGDAHIRGLEDESLKKALIENIKNHANI